MIASVLTFAAVASAKVVMMPRAIPSTAFTLYGYGDGISGLPVIYANQMAFLGNPSDLNITSDITIFTASTSDSSALVANPNTTVSSNATWGNQTYYLPGATGDNKQTGFLNYTSGSAIYNGFFFYGSTAMHINSDGDLESMWYATPYSDNVYKLNWNSTGDDSSVKIDVALKTTAPSN